MSFTDQVKHELTRNKSSHIAELAALIRMNGSIQINNNQLAVTVKLHQGELARRLYSLIKDNYDLDLEIIVQHINQLNYNKVYKLVLVPQSGIKNLLINLGFLDNNNDIIYRIKKDFNRQNESGKAYLRGVFLGGGSVNDPSSEYHLELRCNYETHAEDILSLIKKFNLKAYLNNHNSKYVVYFKCYNEIIKFLNIIGASNAQLKMEEIHLVKEVKNNVNRKVNAETANLDKTVEAAMKQLENIEIIEKTQGLNSLSVSLQEIAVLRKQNPFASLKELGELLEPSLSKSGVNHRMRRIKKIADQFKTNDHNG